jgi:hypothetical protein
MHPSRKPCLLHEKKKKKKKKKKEKEKEKKPWEDSAPSRRAGKRRGGGEG